MSDTTGTITGGAGNRLRRDQDLAEQGLADLDAGGADRVAVGIAVGDPPLAAQRHHRDSLDVRPDDVGLVDVVGESLVVAVGGGRGDDGLGGALGHGPIVAVPSMPEVPMPRSEAITPRLLRKIPGVAVGTLVDGRVEVSAYGSLQGDPSPSSRCWEIGSITKVFTGILLAEMSIRGEVHLDDPIGRFVPDAVASRLPPLGEQPTLAALATHTSGLPRLPRTMIRKVGRSDDPYARLTVDDVWQHLGSGTRRPARPRHRYSNYGMGLLGHLLERAAGEPYDRLVRTRVLDPLGLASTGFGDCCGEPVEGFRKGRPTPPWTFGALGPAGALRSTIGDMLAFAGRCIDPPEGTIGEALELAAGVHHRGRLLRVGLGWMHRFKPGAEPSSALWHNGGTYGAASFLAVDRVRRVAVAGFGNSGPGLTSPLDKVGWSVLDSLPAS